MKHVEVELKFPLLNPEKVIGQLNEIAIPQNQEQQEDTYFVPKHRNFLAQEPVSEWLRLRHSRGKTTINYKKWHKAADNKTVSCDEFESELRDSVAMQKIFDALDMHEIVKVDKKRSAWKYKSTEIAIDRVAGLGCFIEIEAKGEFKDVESAKNHLHQVLKEFDAQLGEQDFRGYPYLLLEKKGLLQVKK